MIGANHINASEQYVYVINVDSIGNTLWTRICKRPGFPFSENGAGLAIERTYDSCYVITGFITDGGVFSYCFLLKLSSNGNVEWMRIYYIEVGFSGGTTLTPLLDGGYLIGGYVDTISSNFQKAFLLKTDSIGQTKWIKKFAYDGQSGSALNKVIESYDGGYIMAGTNNSKIFVSKTDTSGNFLWTKKYEGSTIETCNLWQTPDSNLIITNLGTYGNVYSFIIKTNIYGDTIWSKLYDKNFRSSSPDLDGGVVFGSGNNGINCPTGLVKTDSVGNILWIKCYCCLQAFFGNAVCRSDDSYFLAGSDNIMNNVFYYYLIKTDPLGQNCSEFPNTISVLDIDTIPIQVTTDSIIYYEPYITDSIFVLSPVSGLYGTSDCYSITLQSDELNPTLFSVSPNPFNDKINVLFSDYGSGRAILKLYDSMGKKILERSLAEDAYTIDVSFLPKGIFLITIQSVNGIYSAKIVKGD